MLRYELGDSLFFGAINEYLKRLAHGNSTTDTLQKICEEYSGKDLDWFFQQWIYNKGWPILEIHSEGSESSNNLHFLIRQIEPFVQRPYVNLPLEMKIKYSNDSVEYKMINISNWDTNFVIEPVLGIRNITYNNGPSLRTLVELHDYGTGVDETNNLSTDIIAYPNPANNYVRLLFKKIYANANLKIFNTLGEEVMVLDFETEKNNEMKLIDVSNLPNGVYFIVIHSGKNTDTVRISVQH